jgi:hypothetical protein
MDNGSASCAYSILRVSVWRWWRVSLSCVRVTRELDAIDVLRGYPTSVISDNGTELTSTAILRWSQDRSVAR